MGLWTIDLDWKCIVCLVVGYGRIKDIDEEAQVKDASNCGGEDKTSLDGKIDKDKNRCGIVRAEGVINEMDELLVKCGGGRTMVPVQIALMGTMSI